VAFRRVLGVVAVAAAAGLAVAGCAPIKMGAAAIVGDNSVSIAQLDAQTGLLTTAAKQYPPQGGLTQQQITQATLTWLIRFEISDKIASQNGISPSQADLSQLQQGLTEQAQQSGQSVDAYLVSAGIPPQKLPQVLRYLAIENGYIAAANGGTLPASGSAAATAAQNQYTHATCVAAKSLNIKVNPQFGQLNYTQLTVVDTTDTVSLPSGTIKSSSPGGLSPDC
jgi:hypothetical protein